MNGDDGVRDCPDCGRTSPANLALCPGCGRTLLGVPIRAAPPPVPSETPLPRTEHFDPDLPPRPFVPLSEEALYPPAERGGRFGIARGGGLWRRTRRRRSPAALAAGLALLVAGITVIVAVYTVNAAPKFRYVHETDAGNDAWPLSVSTLTGLTAQVAWYGGTSTADVVYVTWGPPSCVIPSGVVGSGTGDNGTLSAPIDPGTTYYLYACSSGSPMAMNFTVRLFGGLTLGEVVAGFAVGIGGGLMAMGLRGQAYLEHPKHPLDS